MEYPIDVYECLVDLLVRNQNHLQLLHFRELFLFADAQLIFICLLCYISLIFLLVVSQIFSPSIFFVIFPSSIHRETFFRIIFDDRFSCVIKNKGKDNHQTVDLQTSVDHFVKDFKILCKGFQNNFILYSFNILLSFFFYL